VISKCFFSAPEIPACSEQVDGRFTHLGAPLLPPLRTLEPFFRRQSTNDPTSGDPLSDKERDALFSFFRFWREECFSRPREKILTTRSMPSPQPKDFSSRREFFPLFPLPLADFAVRRDGSLFAPPPISIRTQSLLLRPSNICSRSSFRMADATSPCFPKKYASFPPRSDECLRTHRRRVPDPPSGYDPLFFPGKPSIFPAEKGNC